MPIRRFAGNAVRKLIGQKLYTRLRIGLQAEHSYLRRVSGVIHIGANEGQERFLYAAFDLKVVWVEPIPQVFEILKENISGIPKQRALNYLVMNKDRRQYEFHIANNGGASSSVLDLARHKEMWPEIGYTGVITLTGFTLKTVFEQEHIDIREFDALVLDTQGSEYTILLGAKDILRNFKFVKVEAPNFESYKECCEVTELSSFMLSCGFREDIRVPFMEVAGIGTYFDVIYKRVDC